MRNISRFLARNWNLCNFGRFLPKFGCHGNSLNSLENSGSTFEFTKPIKPYWTCEKFLDFLQEMEICAILAYFFNGNSLGSLENWDSIFEVDDPKTRLFMQKSPRFLAQNWNQCNCDLFLLKFGCHGNSLGSLKIMIAYWDSPVPKSQLYMRKIYRFLAENWWVHLLPKFGCRGNRPDSHEILYIVFEFADPKNLLIMW